MSSACIYRDEAWRCNHQDRRRTGNLADVFGDRPGCKLLVLPTCELQDEGKTAEPADNVWAKLAEKE